MTDQITIDRALLVQAMNMIPTATEKNVALKKAIRAELEKPVESCETEHEDDLAVNRFAARMKWKLANARARGKSGWQDRSWMPEQISTALRQHVDKGDPIDVANYCMFLACRGEPITPTPTAAWHDASKDINKVIDDLIESAKLLGRTQAKCGFGIYTQDDAHMERSFWEVVDARARAIRDEVAALKAELDLARAQLEAEYRINSETLSILERTEQKLNVLLDRAAITKAEGRTE